jgi:hypothetical protein
LASPRLGALLWRLLAIALPSRRTKCRAGAPPLLVSDLQHLLLRVQPSGASPATLAQAVGGDPRRSGVGGGRRSRLLLQDFLRVLGAKSRPLFVFFLFWVYL